MYCWLLLHEIVSWVRLFLFRITIRYTPVKNLSITINFFSPNNSDDLGYPMSQYLLKSTNHKLSYAALEVACHAIEKHCDKLKTDNYDLKVRLKIFLTIYNKKFSNKYRFNVNTLQIFFYYRFMLIVLFWNIYLLKKIQI